MRIKTSPIQGTSLVEVLVSLSLILGLVSILMQQFSVSSNVQKNMGLQADLEILKLNVLRKVHCGTSGNLPKCPKAGFVALNKLGPDSLPKPFISDSGKGTTLGPWTLRAECSASGIGFTVRAVRLSKTGSLTSQSPGDFLPDPVTKKVITWSDPESFLFPPEITLCSGQEGVFPPPNFISEWKTPPFKLVHNLGTTKLKIVFEKENPLEHHTHYLFANGRLVGLLSPGVFITDLTPDSLSVEVYDRLNEISPKPKWGPLPPRSRRRLLIWRIN